MQAGQGNIGAGSDSAPRVLIVLTDETLIYERREVAAELVDDRLRQLNAEISNFAPATSTQWRRAISYREAVKIVCGACGEARCLCGANRLRFRAAEARR